MLDGVDVEAGTDVPRDMAVEGPDAWVVGHVFNDDVAGCHQGTVSGDIGCWHKLHISALRVLCVSLNGAVPLALALGEDPEVVAVKMHGVGDWSGVVDVKANGAIATEIVDVPLFWKAEVTLASRNEDWCTG